LAKHIGLGNAMGSLISKVGAGGGKLGTVIELDSE
jgi:hypothetical protein